MFRVNLQILSCAVSVNSGVGLPNKVSMIPLLILLGSEIDTSVISGSITETEYAFLRTLKMQPHNF